MAKNDHGDIFEGNACRKLIMMAYKLLDPEILGDIREFVILPFISIFKALNKIVINAFSNYKPSADLEKDIMNLRKCSRATGVSETLKIHVVLYHIDDALPFLNRSGLGLWSEQVR